MRQWPIAVDEGSRCSFIGIPIRFRDSAAAGECYLTLEELAGDQWSQTLLSALLPQDRAWAWWTRSSAFKRSGLPSRSAPVRIDAASLDQLRIHRRFWGGTTLAFIPPGQSEAQQKILYWAGLDAEHEPDQLWVAGPETHWDPVQISSWCNDASQWRLRQSAATQPAQMIVVMFDSHWYCACVQQSAERVLATVHALAAGWKLQVVREVAECAWPDSLANR